MRTAPGRSGQVSACESRASSTYPPRCRAATPPRPGPDRPPASQHTSNSSKPFAQRSTGGSRWTRRPAATVSPRICSGPTISASTHRRASDSGHGLGTAADGLAEAALAISALAVQLGRAGAVRGFMASPLTLAGVPRVHDEARNDFAPMAVADALWRREWLGND